jgi:hypothetical protein
MNEWNVQHVVKERHTSKGREDFAEPRAMTFKECAARNMGPSAMSSKDAGYFVVFRKESQSSYPAATVGLSATMFEFIA